LPDIGTVIPELETGIQHDLEGIVLRRRDRKVHHPQFDRIEDEIFIARPDPAADTII
jgi:hypothetical protein